MNDKNNGRVDDAHLRIYNKDGLVASFNIALDPVDLAREIFDYYVAGEQ